LPALSAITGAVEPEPSAQLRDGEILPGALVGFENATGKGDHRLAVGGQRHSVGIADEEPPPRRLFETPNMLADRGLAQVQPASGLAEARGLGDSQKSDQQLRFEPCLSGCLT